MTKEIQLKLNAECIAGMQYNSLVDGNDDAKEFYPAPAEKIIEVFYTDLFNMKCGGQLYNGKWINNGSLIEGNGICDDLKFLGEEACKNALIEAFANEGLLMLVE